MQKLFYLLFDEVGSDAALLRKRIGDRIVPILRSAGGQEISLFVDDDDVAAGSPVRQSDPPIRAAISFGLPRVEDRDAVEGPLEELVSHIAGYLVSESRPLHYNRTKGKRASGAMQMSCIRKRSDLSHEEFMRIWHEDHEGVAIETQSTLGYVRNEILRVLTKEATDDWSAFVEETFPIEALTDPMVFWDAETDAELATHQKKMMDSCGRFLDLSRIEVTHMSEYYFG